MSKNNTKYCWINVTLVSVVIVLLGLVVKSINPFGSISKKAFILVNVIYLIVALLIIVLTVRANYSKKRSVKAIFTSFMVVLLLGSVYLYYITNVVNKTVNNIVTQETSIEYNASFVVRNNTFSDVEQLKNKKVGLIDSEEFIEGNVLPKDELKKLEYEDVKVKTYSSYPLLINALVKEEVDFISLPKEYETLFLTDEHVADNLDDIKDIYTFSGKYDVSSTISGSSVDVTKVPFTMLIMGNDGGRTDSLMLATVNPASMQITLTSIARDSYVPIACYPNQSRDKINHARSISRDCSIATVENLFDISIDFFVEVTFTGLVDLVDALGTITIDSPAAFGGNIVRDGKVVGGVSIPKGVSELNGDQVLAFVRERHSFENGDFQRQANQQQAIGALIQKIAETRDPNTLLNIIKATGKNVETNFSVPQLIDLMNLALTRMNNTFLNSSDIVTIYGNRVSGQSAMIFSPDYGFDLYYYIPYKASIADAKKLMAMNMREDGILDIPQGFNYSANKPYTPPTFGKEFYNESVDESIYANAPQRPEEEEEFVSLEEMKGWTLEKAEKYLNDLGFEYVINETLQEETTDESKLNKLFVASTTLGVKMNEENNIIRLNVVKYVLKSSNEDEVILTMNADINGKSVNEVKDYLNSINFTGLGLEYVILDPIEVETDNEDLVGKVYVANNESTLGKTFTKNSPKLVIKTIKYVANPTDDNLPGDDTDN